jgi:hypothetical protein
MAVYLEMLIMLLKAYILKTSTPFYVIEENHNTNEKASFDHGEVNQLKMPI